MGKVFMRNIGGSGGENARLLVTAPQGSSVVATKGTKIVNCEWKQIEIPNPDAHNLPEALQEVEWIGSSGNPYIYIPIDTNIKQRVEAKFKLSQVSSRDYVFGNGGSADENEIQYSLRAGAGYTNFKGYGHGGQIDTGVPTDTNIHEFILDNKNIFLEFDGTRYYGLGLQTGTTKRHQYLFAYSRIGVADTTVGIVGNIYYAKYYNDDVLVGDFIPCYIKQGYTFEGYKGNTSAGTQPAGTIGMYDTVSGHFIINSGTGTFTKGADVPQFITQYYYVGSLNEYGVWTVTATKGTDTASDTVEVSEATDYNLELSFRTVNTTYLFYLGDECDENTGGWIGGASGGWTTNVSVFTTRDAVNDETKISLQNWDGEHGLPCYATKNKIDTTGYNKVITQVQGTSGINNASVGGGFRFEKITAGDGYSGFGAIGNTFAKGFKVNDITNNGPAYYVVNSEYYKTCKGYVYMVALMKQDDISSLSQYGSTISAIIANATSLLADQNAVNNMIMNCTGDFMWTALSTASFITALNSSSYKSLVYANEEWAKALQLIV